ncbi:MAG: hypothetical protein LBQ68_06300 [Clostridiales bacterium]|jgi:hypothetical protein|nr:hypothetical protein [Clostridiales bacterium]
MIYLAQSERRGGHEDFRDAAHAGASKVRLLEAISDPGKMGNPINELRSSLIACADTLAHENRIRILEDLLGKAALDAALPGIVPESSSYAIEPEVGRIELHPPLAENRKGPVVARFRLPRSPGAFKTNGLLCKILEMATDWVAGTHPQSSAPPLSAALPGAIAWHYLTLTVWQRKTF